MSADIVSILDIDEISSIFQVQFFLHFSWFDPRLTFHNLKADTGLNALSPEEKQKIWVPNLVFANTENRLSTLVDEDSILTITRSGNYTLPDTEDVENTHLFAGLENKITLSRFYNIRFLCYYNMQWYPFDVQVHLGLTPLNTVCSIQTCSLLLKMKGKSGDFASLYTTDQLQYLGVQEVNQYVVYSYKMFSRQESNEVEIVIKVNQSLIE